VYEDLGSEEVAQFAEEHLSHVAEEIREHGTQWIPLIHFLPGPGSKESDESQHHVRGAGAFDNPETLQAFVAYLRTSAEKSEALAVIALVPKPALGYPQTWMKAKWPCGGQDGVFVQLESRAGLCRVWWIPVEGRSIGTPITIDAEEFGILPRLIKA